MDHSAVGINIENSVNSSHSVNDFFVWSSSSVNPFLDTWHSLGLTDHFFALDPSSLSSVGLENYGVRNSINSDFNYLFSFSSFQIYPLFNARFSFCLTNYFISSFHIDGFSAINVVDNCIGNSIDGMDESFLLERLNPFFKAQSASFVTDDSSVFVSDFSITINCKDGCLSIDGIVDIGNFRESNLQVIVQARSASSDTDDFSRWNLDDSAIVVNMIDVSDSIDSVVVNMVFRSDLSSDPVIKANLSTSDANDSTIFISYFSSAVFSENSCLSVNCVIVIDKLLESNSSVIV